MSLAIIVMNFTLYRMFNACDRRNKLRFPEDERNSFKSNSLKSLFKSHLAIGGGFNLLQYLHAVAIPYEAPAPRTAPIVETDLDPCRCVRRTHSEPSKVDN